MLFIKIILRPTTFFYFFFFNDTATTEIYTLSLHDALPISTTRAARVDGGEAAGVRPRRSRSMNAAAERSEEHTSELQSPDHLVCRLLLEKKKKSNNRYRFCKCANLVAR